MKLKEAFSTEQLRNGVQVPIPLGRGDTHDKAIDLPDRPNRSNEFDHLSRVESPF
jgi:hypothetical protein